MESVNSLKSELSGLFVDLGVVLDDFGNSVDFSSDGGNRVDLLGSAILLLLDNLVVVLVSLEDVEHSSLCLL